MRRRRRRISITAGEVSEANGTCGLTVIKRCVLEEGEHKSYCSKASLCSPSSRTTFGQHRNRRLRCLRQLNQRLKIFAAFGDAFSRSMPTTYKQRFKMQKKELSLLSLLSLKQPQAKIQNAKKKLSLLSLLSLKQPQAKISIVVKNNRKQEQIFCFKNKKSVLKKSIQTKRGCKPSLRTQAIKQ